MRAKHTPPQTKRRFGKIWRRQSLSHKQNKVLSEYVSTTPNSYREKALLPYHEVLPTLFSYFINLILDLLGNRNDILIYLYPRTGETREAIGSLLNI